MQAFIVSIVAGCLFPGLPIIAELGLRNAVQLETLALTGIVYTAAVGFSSRYQAVAISSFFFSTICAIIPSFMGRRNIKLRCTTAWPS
jgi:hypothetical protein